jgi:hypothetical protein
MKFIFKSTSLFFFFLTTLFFNSIAQKINRENFEYRYVHIPEKLIYDQIKTYGININVIPSSGFNLDYTFANNVAGTFNAYSKVPYESADMQLKVNYGPFQAIEEKTISWAATEEVNGVKTSVTKYKRKLTYKFTINYTVSNRKNGVRFFYNELTDPIGGRSVESAESKTELEAVNSFTQNKQVLLANDINNMVQSFCSGSSAAARDLYDFYPTMGYGAIFKFKKWDRADEYNDHVKHAIKTFSLMTADDNTTMYAQKLNDDINYFKQFEGKFKPDDKDEDILYFGNYYNLASIYTFLDNYEKAAYYLQKLDSSKKEKSYTSGLKNILDRLNRRNAKHFLTTTHLTYNPVSDYRLADKKFASDALSSTELMSQSVSGGVVATADELLTAEGKTLKGKIFVEKETGQLKMIASDNKDVPILLTPSNCISFKIDSIHYFVAKETLAGVFQKYFYKVAYQSSKIKLLQMVRSDLGEIKDYLSIIRSNEDLATAVVGTGMKKKLAKYFEDCPTVSDKAKSGDYSFGIFNTSEKAPKFIEMCQEYTACK